MHLDSKAILSAFPFLQKVVSRFPSAEIYLVGGAVRDLLLKGKGADYDFMIRNVPATDLEEALSREGKVVLAGREFGVFKFYPGNRGTIQEVDIALPRREVSLMTGGYRDFDVQSDPTLPVEEDLSRRDFTVNAMALSLFDGRLIDPFGGVQDLQSQRLRAVGDPLLRFAEDSSRLLRGIRFACQLGFEIEPSTWTALVSAVPRLNAHRSDGSFVVPREVIAKELLRALVSDPVRALDLFDQSGIVQELLPELIPMKGCPQPPEFHSEGDVWTHTRLALSHLLSPKFTEEFGDVPADGELVLATLLHDVGKPYTIRTPERDGTDRIRFNEHDRVGSEIAMKISHRLKLSQLPREGSLHVDPERLSWLIGKHLLLVHGEVDKMRGTTLERHFLNPNRPGDQLRKLIFVDGMASVPEGGEGQLEG
ncbi:MAG TPA: HDIG domain-containing protein, partial [Nitrospiria bacterium]|nr:HDIG domain-containing protein [Nitrospiria bacterium]